MASAYEQFLGDGSALMLDQQAFIGNAIALVISSMGIIAITLILYSSIYFSHTPHQMLVLSLCVADYILCIFGALAVGGNLVRGSWPSGQNGLRWCLINNFFMVATVITSVSSYTLIALERYLVIFYRLSRHETKTKIAIVIFWTITGLVGLHGSSDAHNLQLTPSKLACTPKSVNTVGFLIVFPLLAISPSIMVCCYYSIFKYYANRQSESRKANDEQGLDTTDKKRQLRLKLIVITGSFLALFAPFVVIKVFEIGTQTQVSPDVDCIRTALHLLNAIVSPECHC